MFFGGIGRIHHSLTIVSFNVSRLQDLVFVILPHFKDYPLLTQKSIDFQLFSSIVELINKGLHRTEEGLNQIVAMKAAMNRGLSEKLKAGFPNVTAVVRENALPITHMDPHWVSGFSCGDGCFNISTNRNSFTPRFMLIQHIRDHSLLLKFKDFFGCGGTIIAYKQTTCEYRVNSIKNCFECILPHFDKFPSLGWKEQNYQIWREIVMILYKGSHQTVEGKARILKLKSVLNKYPN